MARHRRRAPWGRKRVPAHAYPRSLDQIRQPTKHVVSTTPARSRKIFLSPFCGLPMNGQLPIGSMHHGSLDGCSASGVEGRHGSSGELRRDCLHRSLDLGIRLGNVGPCDPDRAPRSVQASVHGGCAANHRYQSAPFQSPAWGPHRFRLSNVVRPLDAGPRLMIGRRRGARTRRCAVPTSLSERSLWPV